MVLWEKVFNSGVVSNCAFYYKVSGDQLATSGYFLVLCGSISLMTLRLFDFFNKLKICK